MLDATGRRFPLSAPKPAKPPPESARAGRQEEIRKRCGSLKPPLMLADAACSFPSSAPPQVAWHPKRCVLAAVSGDGRVYLWAKVFQENWSAFAPDFKARTRHGHATGLRLFSGI